MSHFAATVQSVRFILLSLLIILSLNTAWAVTAVMQDISKESLQSKIDAITTRQGLDDALKAKIIKLYQSAQDNVASSERFKSRSDEFKQALKQAPATTKKLQKDNEQQLTKPAKVKIDEFAVIGSDELAQRLILEKSKLSNVDERRKKIDSDLLLHSNRLAQIHEETLTAQKNSADVQKNLAMSPPNDSPKLVNDAQQIYLTTLLNSHDDELKMLEAEAISNPSRVELLKAQLQAATLESNSLSLLVSSIEELLTDRREQEAQAIKDSFTQIEKDLQGKPIAIQELTRKNIQYSRELQTITGKIDDYGDQKNKIDAQTMAIDADFKSAEKKIALAGLSPALGKILREQRRGLFNQNQFDSSFKSIQDETALVSLAQFKVDDELEHISDFDTNLMGIMSKQVSASLAAEQRLMIQAELRVLLSNQREVLNKLTTTYSDYLRVLSDFDFARQQMLEQKQKFALYLDEHLLWVPSSAPLNLHSIKELYSASRWLLSPFNGMMLIDDTVKLIEQKPILSSFVGLALFATFFAGHWAKRNRNLTASRSDKAHTEQFLYTLKIVTYNVVAILPLPLLLYTIGWFLNNGFAIHDFSKAIAAGLQGAAISLFFIQFLYYLFAPTGIAQKHFHWQESNLQLLHYQLGWLRFVAVPTIFLIHCTALSKNPVHSDSLGRLALLISLSAMAIFLSRLLHPDKGLLRDTLKTEPDGWLSALRYFWYPAALLIPLVIIGFAVAGYYLSALELQQKFVNSLRLVFIVIILYEVVMRWLNLANRQLAISNAQQKRKANALTEKQLAGSEDINLPINEQLLDIPKINAQTIRLLNMFIGFSLLTGFWMIWKNILPAFSFLDDIVLWHHLVNHDNQEIYQPVVLTNLMLASLYLFVTVVSVRNFSGVMELLIFRRLALEIGSRYTINQLAKYFLISVGFIAIINELGGSWSQVQWLVAALGVGLGFGLQEIFANLVSGIILLFERPIRIGDTVTVGDVTGKVSRIQMRATTIIDWDQKELIVPNKTFITNQLVNWTLSDATTRVVIPIGIAHNSNVNLAHKVMLETVQTTPLVLADPEPSVLFLGFGDSSLNFSIRVFVGELANRLPVTHNLHVRLEQACRENNIEIPFPQHDVHIHN